MTEKKEVIDMGQKNAQILFRHLKAFFKEVGDTDPYIGDVLDIRENTDGEIYIEITDESGNLYTATDNWALIRPNGEIE